MNNANFFAKRGVSAMMTAMMDSHSSIRCLEALEERIVESLIDLDALSTKAAEMEVVSSEVKKRLDSLDPRVPRPRKIRYLLIHAYEQLEANPRKLGRWLKVLAKHGVPSAVLERVEKAGGAGAIGTNVGGGHEERCPQKIATFSEEHVGVLIEILASHSGKWREIRMSLNLPHSVEKSIEARLHMYSDTKCLNEVLHEWIVRSHEHAKAPTLENLKKALESKTAGLGKTASHLHEALVQNGVCFTSIIAPGISRKPINESNTPSIEVVSQTLDTEVTEDKSTLLEVEVEAVSTCGDTISYQWVKDGHPLNDDSEHYLGSNKSILCITASRATYTEGTYTCEMREISSESEQQDAVAVSKPAVVKVNITHCKKVLIDMYLAQSDVHKDAWPPVSNRTYTNLALVKLDKQDIHSYSTIEGDVDDVVYKKMGISYEQAFSEHKSGALLLIEGRPGSGKTTLVHKVSEDWAAGKPVLKGAKLVFLISLRVLSIQTSVEMMDIIKLFYRNDETARNMLKELDATNGEGVCFIMDGLDEYEKPKSVVFELVHKTYLQQSMVIVSSRPSATIDVRQKAHDYINVIGFLKNEICKYILNHSFTTKGSAQSLLSYLNQHPNVLRMCYLPVHVAMITFLHDKMESCLPSTECKIYKHFTELTLRRKEGTRPPNSEVILMRTCKLAFQMTISRKLFFVDEELCLPDTCFGNGNLSLGLVTIDRTTEIYDYNNLYSFVHLTFQEYLAAYHISKLEGQEQRKVISKYGHMKHMREVWRFYCGLISFDNEDSKLSFLKILELHDDSLFHCQCAFESQQPATCKSVVLHNQNSLRLSTIHPADFTCLQYVISNSSSLLESLEVFDSVTGDLLDPFIDVLKQCSQLKRLQFDSDTLGHEGAIRVFSDGLRQCSNLTALKLYENEIGDESVKVLGDGLMRFSNLSHLSILFNNVGDEGAKGLGDGLRHCSNLSVLELDINQIGDEGAKNLVDGLKHCNNLSQVSISDNSIGDEGAKSLCECLRQCSNLSELHLDSNDIGDEGAIGLGCGLRHSSNLSVLTLSYNIISDEGARSLGDGLSQCTNLSELHLDYNEIGDEGAKYLGIGLRQCSNLSELHLWHNHIGDEGAQGIGYGLSQCVNLSVLNVADNNISDKGAKVIGDGLSQCKKLSVLNFNNNKVDDEGAKGLGNGIRQCSNLSKIKLNDNTIGDEGAKGLFDGLKQCSNLSVLELNDNKIGDEGAKCLGDCLKQCSSLSILYMNNNKIGDTGAMGLSSGLRQCSNLSELRLNFNAIGDEGAKCFGYGLRCCKKLSNLFLGNNKIGNEGAICLGVGLGHCHSLSVLHLHGNKIGDEGTKGLADGLSQCSNLSTLLLYDNEIGDEGEKCIRDGLIQLSRLRGFRLGWEMQRELIFSSPFVKDEYYTS